MVCQFSELWAQIPELILNEHLRIRKLAVDLIWLASADSNLRNLCEP